LPLDQTDQFSLGYVRVDSEDASVRARYEQQNWAIARFARRNGYRHLQDIEDVGWTRRPEELPGFRQVIELARARRFARLLVWRIDRLPGSATSVLDTLVTLHEQFGVSVRSVTEPVDTLGGPVRALAGALRNICRQERRELVDLRRKGKREKADQGALASGAVPFGYRLDDAGEMVVDPPAATVIRRIYSLRDEGCSLRLIAETLNAEGLATRRGGRWHAGTVRYILENPKYRGYVSYNFRDDLGFVLRQGSHAPIIA
jgi:site-specific DNA recombinase